MKINGMLITFYYSWALQLGLVETICIAHCSKCDSSDTSQSEYDVLFETIVNNIQLLCYRV